MSAAASRTYDHIAVVIPAHNEQDSLPDCLSAVVTAALCVPLPVVIVVVLDASEDESAQLAGDYGTDVHFVRVESRNVGAARAAGFDYARDWGGTDTNSWYATTDADSTVNPDWLVRQLDCGADMFLGLVRVTDWEQHRSEVVDKYEHDYDARVDDEHDHIHGANMAFSSSAYWRVGGFRALTSGEDVDLVARFEHAGYRICRDTARSVVTSARIQARAPRGFADHLSTLSESATGDVA
ncbi:glycosyltransferase family 2 protein [Mycobacterium sp. TY814]|uniref:glycosyltransferase n=1 Tax=unclassified Mycobacterium TaxID=2642494 RepID=UPI000F99EC2E|nr:glycosyltransferase [Mycobacterium sp. TY814]MDP7725793.1 glycosyltransferase [Mycobacterium sp. TY814]RUP04794.1 MAG: glycosyltransferase [Mycobacterium sp.]